jgi:hypothetical protein
MTETATEPKPFDFGSFAETQVAMETGKEFEIVDDLGRPTGVFFYLHGVSSSRYRIGRRELQNRRMSKEVIDAAKDEYQQGIEDDALVYSWCFCGWRTVTKDKAGKVLTDEQVVYLKGEKLPYSRESAERVLLLSDYIRGQIKMRVEVTAGFTSA